MKKIGLILHSSTIKVKNVFNFVDEIISVENIGPDKSLYGQCALHDKLKVIYKFNGQIQTSTITAHVGGRQKI